MSTPAMVRDVVRAIRRVGALPDDAKTVHDALEAGLRRAGFSVMREYSAPYDNRAGRIDLVAWHRSAAVAIEIDQRSPRRKSVKKLQGFHGGRVIVLRGRLVEKTFDGIDAIVRIPVRRAP